jgi:UDP-N-acetylglucosamine 2-epimerase (non-hydrolysing)
LTSPDCPDGRTAPSRILIVIGTRPEAIKMASVIAELRARQDVECVVCSTGQHGSMLTETLEDLGYAPDQRLDIMDASRAPARNLSVALHRLDEAIAAYGPDWVLVQGDTTSAAAGALAAFLRKVKVGHIEAGLRTGTAWDPFPEEAHRRMISTVATLHFAPTQEARDNLLRENIRAADILVTGNTVIDALYAMRERLKVEPLTSRLTREFGWLDRTRRTLLVTAHRRENVGAGLQRLCDALMRLAQRSDVEIVFPVHLNPAVRVPVRTHLEGIPHVHLLEPQPYSSFVHLMTRAHLLLTDSGGIQEECTALGRPALVVRDTTERGDGVRSGTTKLIGSETDQIVSEVTRLLDDASAHEAMSRASGVFGDGTAGRRIVESLFS